MKFNEGDLVYIPQAVFLWADTEQNYLKTEKPLTAVCIGRSMPLNEKTNDRLIHIYAKGRAWAVHEKDVYPMEVANVG